MSLYGSMVSIITLAENKKKNNIGRLIADIFTNNWDKPFIYDSLSRREFSYSDFLGLVLSYRQALKKHGLRKGNILAAIMDNSLELLTLYFASLAAGLKVVPIDPQKGENDIKDILAQLPNKKIVKQSDGIFKKISSVPVEKKSAEIFAGVDYNASYLISFTSGSTGRPKGVMHSFGNLTLSALAFNKRFNFGAGNIFYHNLPMTYMAGILNLIFLPFLAGSKIIIGTRFGVDKMARFWELPIKYRANTFWFAPTFLSLLLQLDRDKLGLAKIRRSKILGCVGMAPLNAKLKNDFEKKYKISLYESYGLSETLFVSSSYQDSNLAGSVGKPLAGVKIKFEKDGELTIRTPWNFQGYLGGKAAESFFSGDLGKSDEDGNIFITGRKKDLIIRGGLNISPRRIEDFLVAEKFCRECAVLGLPDPNLGEKTTCFLVSDKLLSKNYMQQHINAQIVKKLGRSCQVDEFIVLAQLPKNINGKIDKIKIREIYETKLL